MTSPFDLLMDAADSTILGVLGETASWTPSAGGAAQTGTVIYQRPMDPRSLGFDDYLAAGPSIEYHPGTFDALRAAVLAGNTEQVTVDGQSFRVASVAIVDDGRCYRARLVAATPMQAKEVAGSDKAVVLVVDQVPDYDPATERQPGPVRSTIVDFGKACTIRNLSAELRASLAGTIEAGDVEILIPAALATEAQLLTDGALLTYGTAELTIDRIDPHSVVQGTVVEWRVIGSLRASPNG